MVLLVLQTLLSRSGNLYNCLFLLEFMQKRGWLRIIEASIAILIVLSSLFFVYTKSNIVTNTNLDSRVRIILDEEAIKPEFRAAVFNGDIAFVNSSIAAHIPEKNLAFEVKICSLEDVCGKTEYVKADVYTSERVISSSIDKDPEKGGLKSWKVRLFLWRVY